jgi:hypothetical protein
MVCIFNFTSHTVCEFRIGAQTIGTQERVRNLMR